MLVNKNEFFDFETLPLIDDVDEDTDNTAIQNARQAVQGGVVEAAGQKTRSLQQMMDGYAKALKDFALKPDGTPVKTSSVSYKGFAAEEKTWSFTITFGQNAPFFAKTAGLGCFAFSTAEKVL